MKIVEKKLNNKLVKLYFEDGLIELVEVGDKKYSKQDLEFLSTLYHKLLDFEIEYLRGEIAHG